MILKFRGFVESHYLSGNANITMEHCFKYKVPIGFCHVPGIITFTCSWLRDSVTYSVTHSDDMESIASWYPNLNCNIHLPLYASDEFHGIVKSNANAITISIG